MGELRFVGLDEVGLDPISTTQLNELSEKYMERLGYVMKNEFEIIMHTKAYQESGERKKHAVNMRLNYPGGTVTAGKDDWDFLVAVKGAFDAVNHQLKSKFRE